MARRARHLSGLAWIAAACLLVGLPETARAQKVDAAALCRSDKTEKGIAACTGILKGRGDRKAKASALLSRAQAYWAQKRLVEAEKDYAEAIRLVPSFAALYRDRGQIRYALGNAAGAMVDFDAAIENDPFDPDNHANRGYLRLLQYDFAGAEADFRKGLFWKSPHPRSQYFIGLLHYARGRYGDAVAAIDLARSQGFKGHEAFVTRARSLFYLGSFEAAAREATEGQQAFPNEYDLTEIRARAGLARRDLTEALADAEAVVQAAPAYGRGYATRAAVKLARKDLDGAAADADRAIALDAGLFDAYEVKAEILLAAGDQPAARALLQRSAARSDAKMAYDVASRARAAARVVEMDKPKPIVVAELDEAELTSRCQTRDDALRLQACSRLVETAATPEAKADRLIMRAKARSVIEAIADFDLAVAAAPDYLVATIARARGHLETYGYDADLAPIERAWADADSAVRRAPAGSDLLADALQTRAFAATGKGAYEAAIADLTQLLGTRGDTAFFLGQRAGALLMAGKPDLALADLRERDRLPPDARKYDLGTDDLAVALIETGQVEAALAELERSSRSGSSGATAREALRARALLARGEVEAARAEAEAALFVNPINIGALAVRGLASAKLGNALDAVSDLTKVLDDTAKVPWQAAALGMTPGFTADLVLHRGLARAQLRQGNAARSDFTEAIKLAPDRAEPYGQRARLAFLADNPAALADIAMALRIAPEEPRWLALAARINHATGDMDATERLAGAALAAKAADPDLVVLRAKARLALGRFTEAATDATARLDIAPSDVEALLVRIEARTGQGDLEAALADAQAARAANGGDARILLALAELKVRSGDAPGAIGAFEEAATKSDAALLANKRLGDLYSGIGSEQLALGYYARALELPARGRDDEAARTAARDARDALIRKLAAPK